MHIACILNAWCGRWSVARSFVSATIVSTSFCTPMLVWDVSCHQMQLTMPWASLGDATFFKSFQIYTLPKVCLSFLHLTTCIYLEQKGNSNLITFETCYVTWWGSLLCVLHLVSLHHLTLTMGAQINFKTIVVLIMLLVALHLPYRSSEIYFIGKIQRNIRHLWN